MNSKEKDIQRWGVFITIKLKNNRIKDEFWDAFIVEAIETNGCLFNGGGHKEQLSGVIDFGPNLSSAKGKYTVIQEWFSTREDVLSYTIGDIVNLKDGNIKDDTTSKFDNNR